MKKSKSPLISIITPTYNSELYISKTIESIINQTYKNWELLITDDFSSDNTINIIESYISFDKRIKLFSLKKNSGSAEARNKSITNSSGDFLAFCDSDDIWLPSKLNTQLQFMILNKLSFCFTAYEIINYKGFPINISVDSKQHGFFTYNDMLKKKATLGCCTVMLKKKSFVGLLEMPNIRTGQDYAFWLKLLKYSNHFAYILPRVLSRYRISPNSISRNKFKKAKTQFYIYRKIENINFIKSIYYFFFYALRAIFRTS
jgi:glycosyltransferase involved in cell wall biosynthesis